MRYTSICAACVARTQLARLDIKTARILKAAVSVVYANTLVMPTNAGNNLRRTGILSGDAIVPVFAYFRGSEFFNHDGMPPRVTKFIPVAKGRGDLRQHGIYVFRHSSNNLYAGPRPPGGATLACEQYRFYTGGY